MINSVIQSFVQNVPPGKTVWVGYSGGLDSHVLLYSLSKTPVVLRAIHVNHQINVNSAQWANHCEAVCAALSVPLQVIAIEVPNNNIEAQARRLRYAQFKALMQPGDYLVTAHHQSDQAETVLLQLFRGAGVKGLSAMPIEKSFGEGVHARPLLSVSRGMLEHYAKVHELQWVEDDSNLDCHYSRNFLRCQVMPLLKQSWPTVERNLVRTAKLMQSQQALLNELAEQDLALMEEIVFPSFASSPTEARASSERAQYASLSLKKLRNLRYERQRNVLRYWFSQQHILLPNLQHMQIIINELINARHDSMPKFEWDSVSLRVWRDRLYLVPPREAMPNGIELYWRDRSQPLILPLDLGELHWSELGIHAQPDDEVIVRFRQSDSSSLKKYFQENNIPPWERDYTPLIYVEGQLKSCKNISFGCIKIENPEGPGFIE